jgi:hypothetical protein
MSKDFLLCQLNDLPFAPFSLFMRKNLCDVSLYEIQRAADRKEVSQIRTDVKKGVHESQELEDEAVRSMGGFRRLQRLLMDPNYRPDDVE